MSWQAVTMYAVVAGLGIPSAFRNATAAALVFAWLAGETLWLATGNSLPLSFFFMADIAVISIIYAKMIRRVGAKTYPTFARQLYCLVVDLTVWDRWIVGLFLFAAWPAYVLAIDPSTKWHILWAITIIQFCLAGAEAAQSFVAHLRTRVAPDPPDSSGLAWAGFGPWSTRLR